MSLDIGYMAENKRVQDSKKAVVDLYNAHIFLDKDMPLVKNAFEIWKLDNSYIKDYDNLQLVGTGKVLVRLFFFEQAMSGTLLDTVRTKVLPYAKVIKCGANFGDAKPKFIPGDVLYCPANISEVEITNEWLAWKSRMEKERPQITTPEPQKFDGMLLSWSPSRIILDPFAATGDNWTFLRNQSEFDIVCQ